MTVSQAVPIIDYVGNGVATAFAFDFRIFQALDLVVTVDDVEVTDYTVAITPQPAFGGTVTFTTAPASGAAIRIRRNIPFQRSIDYQQGGDLPEGTLDDDQDAAVMMIQQLAAGSDQRFGSVLRIPDGEAIATLPAAGSRAGRVIAFDWTGQPILVVPSSGGSFGLGVNVRDEGSPLGSDAVDTLDFLGASVSVVRAGNVAQITIGAGGAQTKLPPTAFGSCRMWLSANHPGSLFQTATEVSPTLNTMVTADGQPVGLWTSTGRGWVNAALRWPCAATTTPGDRPTFETDVVAGRSVVRFDGANQRLSVGYINPATGANDYQAEQLTHFRNQQRIQITVALAITNTNAPAVNVWQDDQVIGDLEGYWGLTVSVSSGTVTARWYQYTSGTAQITSLTFPLSSFVVITCQLASGQLRMRVNGGAWSTPVSTGLATMSTQQMQIGSGFGGTRLGMDLSHVALFDQCLSDAETLAVERLLADDVGVTI